MTHNLVAILGEQAEDRLAEFYRQYIWKSYNRMASAAGHLAQKLIVPFATPDMTRTEQDRQIRARTDAKTPPPAPASAPAGAAAKGSGGRMGGFMSAMKSLTMAMAPTPSGSGRGSGRSQDNETNTGDWESCRRTNPLKFLGL